LHPSGAVLSAFLASAGTTSAVSITSYARALLKATFWRILAIESDMDDERVEPGFNAV
jgi:hypothetical protein